MATEDEFVVFDEDDDPELFIGDDDDEDPFADFLED